jgi:hypothetical protein
MQNFGEKTKIWIFFNFFLILGQIFDTNFGDPCDYHKLVKKDL